MKNNAMKITNLTYLNIFDDFNIILEKDKFLTISGPNSCGKTMLLKIIDGQIHTNANITLFEKEYSEYSITEVNAILKTVIPLEFTFYKKNVEEELYFQLSDKLLKSEKTQKVKSIAKLFKLTKKLKCSPEELSKKERIKLQLAISIISNPKILLVDDLSAYFNKKELIELTEILKELKEKENITVIMICSVLDCALLSDYLYIINEGKIVLEGIPVEIIEKDNILNKLGLNLPFMMDLSVKLRDYDLITDIELDMQRMIDRLWN